MGKVTLLFAGKSYDTNVQSVRENQIVIFDGPTASIAAWSWPESNTHNPVTITD